MTEDDFRSAAVGVLQDRDTELLVGRSYPRLRAAIERGMRDVVARARREALEEAAQLASTTPFAEGWGLPKRIRSLKGESDAP